MAISGLTGGIPEVNKDIKYNAMAKLIDIHTHKNNEKGVVTLRSIAVGIDDVATLNTDCLSAGIHPWYVSETDVAEGLEFLAHARLCAIGEIGLDYAREVDKELQQRVFERQLEVAAERNLPVIIHCVKAYGDVFNILRSYELRAVIFHGYIGSVQQTEEIMRRGYYVSVGSRSLQSTKTVDALRACVPVDRLFAETDDSDVGIKEMYTQLSAVYGLSFDELAQKIMENFKTVFK